ncbi:2-nitropropane dioxygenase-like enzyme [Neocallimastix lanati (nom. inval.)]|jgi:enoyl-[acyl-carrier protein] reductase II|uniref:2-nitropropane dioxygenase-like enzyme n=1 Tax=Neocallimastix californiae TaxID=1754190 RepID=A0A1Y2EZR5_9FUNG|nr:2-nitropropane dioxygenase-like enzyme [Neocallimastix sp. JGI-2020a]ORY77131.1 2-nitropropane dioxygenase-like enzyme [Neocallimastix californiae]|eukprot:ORY77131.1 2-nitropropane dioxygenase-like enzyme [Neocallimastix californiae]
MESFKLNRVCKILGIQKPVIQAPLFWITSPKLVAAVSNAGGLGVLGPNAGFEKPVTTVKDTVEEMRKSIRKTRELTDKPFGVNVFTPSASNPFGFSKAIVDLCKEEGVKILVSVGVMDPKDFSEWKNDGFTVIAREMNPTVRGALVAEKAGADIIVATGCDEGGCMPILTTGTTSITALLSDAVKVPVLAAGGIINEKFAKAAAIVGAEGAYVGSRFILSKENRASDAAKKDIMATHPDDYIVYTHMNGTSRWRTTPHKIGREALEANKRGDLNPSSGDFFKGVVKGDLEASVNSVCNVASLIKSIDSCKDIVNEIARGFL